MSLPPVAPVNGSQGPLYSGSSWDVALLGGVKTPGRATVKGAKSDLKLDPKDKSGHHGGRPTTHGIATTKFQLRIVVWTDAQLAELISLRDFVYPPPSPKPVDPNAPAALQQVQSGAIDFAHASVRGLPGFGAVIVVGVSQIEFSSGFGVCGREMTFDLLPWLPSSPLAAVKNATATPQRKVRDVRAEDAARRNPPNPPPTAQPNICGPTLPPG